MRLQPYVKKNLSLAWPLALNALLMQSMLMIDTLLISPLGEVSLAAMGIATTVVAFVIGIQMALANGTQLVLSRSVGASNQMLLSRGYCSGSIINMSVAIVFCLAILICDRNIVEAITDNSALVEETLSYLEISKYMILFNAATQIIIALFNALGRTKIPFKGYLLELPINVTLSYFLIYGFGDVVGLGVKGAAAGSLIAISIRMVFLYVCMVRAQVISPMRTQFNSALKKNVYLHFVEIFPIAANVTMLQIGATIYQLLYAQLNINAYVAITIIMPWIRSGTQFITAWAHSSAITISQAIGSKKMENLRQNVDISIDMAVAISCISALLFLGLSFFISDIYPDLDSETYLALSVIAPLYIFLPLARGYNTVHGHVLRALGKTKEVFKINFTGQWVVSIPLCALIIVGFDGSIFWAFAVQPFEEIVKALPFRHLARKSLDEFNLSKAEDLMYD